MTDLQNSEIKLLGRLNDLFKEVSEGRYNREQAKDLFELTITEKYPQWLTEMAEAFSMMMIKVETREFHLEQVIEDLRLAKLSLEDYSRSLEQKVEERTCELRNKNELLATEIQERLMVEKDLQKANHQLERLSKTDGLTHAANRRFFDEWLVKMWATHAASQTPLGLIICDVDFFKLYNDTYGHQQGDECLKAVVAAIRQDVHHHDDLVARYGGEEFAVVVPRTAGEGIVSLAEKMRAHIEALRILHERSAIGAFVTVSFGAATVLPRTDADPSELIKAADAALYEAKAQGRNRVVWKRV
ncbi:MAG: diguanylate cyclase [Syntrophales bacterium]